MRDILFRGKQEQSGEWVYGYLVQYISENEYTENYILTQEEVNHTLDLGGRIECDMEPVVLETVGQYTGLKDKNDKEIYEGDIIKWVDWSGHKRKTEVRYDEEWKRFCVWLNGAETIGVNKHLSNDIEVIGNIYDNPELTK
jgi:phage uncharacterized protein TIGR01671